MVRPHRTAQLDEIRWSANFAALLAGIVVSGRGAAITWFNHASMARSMASGVAIDRFDYVGVDGLLLRRLAAPATPRTSADLVLPRLLDHLPKNCRVAIVGGRRPNLEEASRAIQDLPSSPAVVFACDGYDGLLEPGQLAAELLERDVQVVILGLGAPLQDRYAIDLVESGMTRQLVVTCGGWLDQVANPTYYPPFAYRMKVNWLIRVVREPGRLWRRYTIEAVRAYRQRKALRAYLAVRAERPFQAMVEACLHETAGRPAPASPPTAAER